MHTKRTIAPVLSVLFVLLVPFISLADSAVCVDLQTAIGQASATNRTVVLTPIAAASSPTRISLLDRSSYDTGTNGYFWVSNVVEGIYQAEVKYPPSTAIFRFYVDGTNAVIYASSNQVAASTATIPSSTHAWSAFASDLRYALKGEVGSSSNLDTNAVAEMIQAATFPLSSVSDRGQLPLWAVEDPAQLAAFAADLASAEARIAAVEASLPATNVQYAARAGFATNAESATNAQYATQAGSANTATSATLATEAGHAAAADHATTATTATNLYGTSYGTHIGEVRPQSGTNIFQVRRTNDNAIVFWITADGKLHGDGSALTGVSGGGTATNVTVASITDANQLTNWAGIAPTAKLDTSALGTAGRSNSTAFYLSSNPSNYTSEAALNLGTAARSNAASFYPVSNPSNYTSEAALGLGTAARSNAASFYPVSNPSNYTSEAALGLGTAARSNAASFYPASNPSNYVAITASTNGNILEVWRTNAPASIVFAIGSNGLLYGDASALTNVTGSSGGVYVAAGNGITATTNNGVVTLSIGASSVSNIYDLNISVITSNLTDWTSIYTNPVSASNTFSGSFWVRGRGPTNSYFGRFDPIYSRGYDALFTYASNVVSSSASLAARPTTNASGVVWQVNGGGNQSVNWSIKGWYEHETNGVFTTAGGGGGSTLTNDMIALWSFEGEPWVDSIGTNTLTESGTVGFPSGLIGLASGFDASPDALSAGTSPDFAVTNGFSFALWLYLNATNANQPFIVKDDVTDPRRVFAGYYSSAGQNFRIAICTNLTGSTITYVTGTTNQHATGQPYFVAGTFNPTNKTVSLYVGTTNANSLVLEKAQVFDPWIPDSNITPIRLGAWSTYLNGKIDEASIWRRSLSGADVTNVWAKALQGKRVNEP